MHFWNTNFIDVSFIKQIIIFIKASLNIRRVNFYTRLNLLNRFLKCVRIFNIWNKTISPNQVDSHSKVMSNISLIYKVGKKVFVNESES